MKRKHEACSELKKTAEREYGSETTAGLVLSYTMDKTMRSTFAKPRTAQACGQQAKLL